MALRSLLLTASLLWAGLALAEDGVQGVSVGVGKTVSTSAGVAVGVVCDDLTIISVAMNTKNKENNQLVITGLKEGKTLCRVGNDQQGPKRFLRVTVSAGAPSDTAATEGANSIRDPERLPR